jgi:hypothetical protein
MLYKSLLAGMTLLLMTEPALAQDVSKTFTGQEAKRLLADAKVLYLERPESIGYLDDGQKKKYVNIFSAFERLTGAQGVSVELEYSPPNPDSPTPSHTWRFYGKEGQNVVVEIYINDRQGTTAPGDSIVTDGLSLGKNSVAEGDTRTFLRIDDQECASRASALANKLNQVLGEPNRPAGKK